MPLKAREGKIGIDDLTGGVFTVSNGGTYGSLLSTPILNPPQSGILGMHNIVQRPVAVDGAVVIRPDDVSGLELRSSRGRWQGSRHGASSGSRIASKIRAGCCSKCRPRCGPEKRSLSSCPVIRSKPWFLLVVCLAGIFLARESRRPGPLEGIDRVFFDWLIANARLPPASEAGIHSSVTLVEIDDVVADTPSRLPLPPLEIASFLQIVGKLRSCGGCDRAGSRLASSAFRHGGYSCQPGDGSPEAVAGRRTGQRSLPSARSGQLAGSGKCHGQSLGIAGIPEIVAAPGEQLLGLAAAIGAVDLPGLAGAPVRDLPLLMDSRNRVLPSFALQTLMLWLRLAPSEVSVRLGSYVQLGDALRLPINRQGRALLDARVLASVHRLGLDDISLLATGQATAETKFAAEQMRGGVVILGRTDRASRTLHLVDGRPMSRAEVFAWSAASPRAGAVGAPGWAALGRGDRPVLDAGWMEPTAPAACFGRNGGHRPAGGLRADCLIRVSRCSGSGCRILAGRPRHDCSRTPLDHSARNCPCALMVEFTGGVLVQSLNESFSRLFYRA